MTALAVSTVSSTAMVCVAGVALCTGSIPVATLIGLQIGTFVLSEVAARCHEINSTRKFNSRQFD